MASSSPAPAPRARILAYTSTGTGTSWQPTAPLGAAASERVSGATVARGGTIIAIGSTAASKVSQRPVFLEAIGGNGMVRQISLTGIPGAVVPELTVNGLATAGGQQVAVGSADGYPAVWRKAAGASLVPGHVASASLRRPEPEDADRGGARARRLARRRRAGPGRVHLRQRHHLAAGRPGRR